MQAVLLPHSAASPYPEVGKTFSIITARVRPGNPRRPLCALALPFQLPDLRASRCHCQLLSCM